MADSVLDEFLSTGEKTNNEYVHTSFRRLILEIPNTNYASHGMYQYPAEFIPQVVRFVIKRFMRDKEGIVFDPFAGGGTVGVEAQILGVNCILWDLNPLIEHLMEAKILRCYEDELIEFNEEVNTLLEYHGKEFLPEWSHIGYWHPYEMLTELKRLWGYVHYECKSKFKPLLKLALIKISREFSYGDNQIPKLFRSKRKKLEIKELLKTDWKGKIKHRTREEIINLYNKAVEFTKLAGEKNVRCEVKGGIDVLSEQTRLDDEISLLITSPPYLTAHEYIRSSKLELFWLGYDVRTIKKLLKLEIPYNRPPPLDIQSPTFKEYREKIKGKRPDLLRYYDAYFYSIISAFEKFGENIKSNGYMAIFVGNASLGGLNVPIHLILREHLSKAGFEHFKTYVDEIKARRLFRGRLNVSPEGIQEELLLVLKKVV